MLDVSRDGNQLADCCYVPIGGLLIDIERAFEEKEEFRVRMTVERDNDSRWHGGSHEAKIVSSAPWFIQKLQ